MTSEHAPKQAKDQKNRPSTQADNTALPLDGAVPLRLNQASILRLQRMVGNRTVQRLLNEQGDTVRRQPESTEQSLLPETVESMPGEEINQQISGARTALADTNLPDGLRHGVSENMRLLQSEAQLRGEAPPAPDAGSSEVFSIEPLPGLTENWGKPRRDRLAAAFGTMRIPLSPTYVRYLLEQTIAQRGERQAGMVLSDLHDYIYSTLGSAKSLYPVDEPNIPDFDAQIEQGDRLFAIVEDQFNLLRKENDRFLEDVKRLAVQLTNDTLNNSEVSVRSEMERYGIPEAQGFGILGTEPADARRTDTQELMRAAGELLAAQQGVQRLRVQQQQAKDELEALKQQEVELQQSLEAVGQQEQQVAYLTGLVWDAEDEYKLLRADLQAEFPMLASFGDNEQLTEMETLSPVEQVFNAPNPFMLTNLLEQHTKLGELEKGSPLAMAYMGKDAHEKLGSIAEVRDELDDDHDLVWKLAPIMAMSRQQMGIVPDTMWDRVLTDRIVEAHDSPWWQKALTVLAIGLSVVAAIPSGGTSLAAGGALLTAELAAVAIDAYLIYDAAHQYSVQGALTRTHFDAKQALSQEEPEIGWLIVDVFGGVIGMAGVTRAARNLRNIAAARRAVLSARYSDEAADAFRALREAAAEAGLNGPQTNRLLRETEEALSAGDQSVAPFRLPAEGLTDPSLIRSLEEIGSADARPVLGHNVAIERYLGETVYASRYPDGIIAGRGGIPHNLDAVDVIAPDRIIQQTASARRGTDIAKTLRVKTESLLSAVDPTTGRITSPNIITKLRNAGVENLDDVIAGGGHRALEVDFTVMRDLSPDEWMSIQEIIQQYPNVQFTLREVQFSIPPLNP